MTTAIIEYEKLRDTLLLKKGVVVSQMFGKPCLKIDGKAFVAQHKETVVFKLTGMAHGKAMEMTGALLWDPSGKGRPMKEWVALTVESKSQFQNLSVAAMAYVEGRE
ncbi:hypothetical protein [Dyella subtropica]|uniref:hypothetical protein n=1 Tax=Dyella subtropica TaxID=2992127 RepID=UPI002251FEF8|nr:hypothetical protein [Dyella subtropica]